MSEIEAYSSFIAEYASFGYARLFIRCGDFVQAQSLLERALIDGYSSWEMRRRLFKSGLDIMTHLTDAASGGEVRAWPGPSRQSSFSQSEKLKAVGDVIDIVRSFSPEEQIALVLLFVEERAEDEVLPWLEKDAGFLDALKSSLETRLTAWSPTLSTGEDAPAFFYRSLRQYRLSAQFCPSILNRVRVTTRLPGTFAWIVAGVLLFGIPGVLMLLNVLDRWSRMSRHSSRYDEYEFLTEAAARAAGPSAADFVLDALILAAAFLLRRYLTKHAPLILSRGPLRILSPLLILSVMGGLVFFGFECLFAINPTPFLMSADWRVYQRVHLAWLVFTAVLVLCVAYSIAVHYLKRIDDLHGIRINGGPK